MSKRLISLSDLKGAMAWFAVVQHPYEKPVGLFEVLDEMSDLAADWKHGLCWFERDHVRPWLNQLWGAPQAAAVLKAWNTSEIDNGALFVAVDRFHGLPPERNFIDIDALFMNIAKAAWDSSEEFEDAA